MSAGTFAPVVARQIAPPVRTPAASRPTGTTAGLPRFAAPGALTVNRPGDAFEQEADRVATAVVSGRSASVSQVAGGFAVQREEKETGPATKKEPTQEEKYQAALKKIGEALLETEAGKELKAKAEALGEKFLASVEGKVLAGTALGGALAALIAANEELPVPIPEIPLDFLAKGLKAKLTWEGPVRTPTSVSLTLTSASGVSVSAGFSQKEGSAGKPGEEKGSLTLTIPLGSKPKKRKKGKSEKEKYRAETDRIAADQEEFREGMKPAAQKKAEDDEFWAAFWQMKEQERKKSGSLMLMRQADSASTAGQSAPPIVHDVLRASGQPLDSATRAFMETRFGHDFSHVRIHTDDKAAESASAVKARAYTVGSNVVFGPGAYAPATDEGKRLLAHELTHTVQQRPGPRTAAAGPSGAGAKPVREPALFPASRSSLGLARQPVGQTAAPTATPTTSPATNPFANEDPALRVRRLAVVKISQPIIDQIRNALARGYIWDFETITATGTTSQITLTEETFAVREARLKQLMVDLSLMRSELGTAPIPYMWTAPDVKFTGKNGGIGGMSVEWVDPNRSALKDTKMFYAHRGQALGTDQLELTNNWQHMDMPPKPTPAVKRAETNSGTDTGIYLVVPDPANAPLVYRRLTGYEGWQRQGVIVTVWSDDVGYYYHGRNGKIYLPERP